MPTARRPLKEVFLDALAVAPDARAAWLEGECAGDPQLRRQVELMLAAHDCPQSLIDRAAPPAEPPVSVVVEGITATEIEQPGALIGPYKLMEQIGEGGMGLVFVAEQQHPVRRKVALKIIKPGMDSKQVLARFEAERQALALMDHPNIAKVHDAGTTEAGRPYFVMELVHGIPITDYCDANKLTPRQRLELFVPVCQAIQHAHQKGVIHRDIKPSNVLVTRYDDKAVPKVIDFGVAKAIEQRLTERTLYTQFGTLVGTFEYMSPEQAEMNAFGVDTRSDIYSLGVLLYELLTGSTPLERARLRTAAFGEIVRLIKEEEPPRPSVRLSTSGELAKVAAARQTDPVRLSRLVRGELDWVVMRCLEKDRTRRYETANGLADDVERYLADEPVQAHPPSVGYRLRKFVRRHWAPMLAAVLILIVLVGGIVGTTAGLLAERATADKEREARESAEKRLAQIEKGNDILGSVFVDLDPGAEQRGGKPLRAVLAEHLDRAVEALDADAVGDPLTVAALQEKLGWSLFGLGDTRKATTLLERAVATRSARQGGKHPLTLSALYYLGTIHRAAGRLDRAIPLLERATADAETALGDQHPTTLRLRDQLALSYQSDGQYRQAVALFERLLEVREATLGDTHFDTLMACNNLALAYADVGDLERPVQLLDRSLQALERTKGNDHSETLWVRKNLADAYKMAGELIRATTLYEHTLKACEAKLGEDHPQTLAARNGLASAHVAAGKFDLAIPLLERTLKTQEAKLGEDHPQCLVTRTNLATAYAVAGRWPLVLEIQRRGLALEEAKLGPDHPETLTARANLATAYYEAGQLDLAVPLIERTVKTREEKSGEDHPRTLIARNSLAAIYRAAGKTGEAVTLYERNLRLAEAKLGESHTDTLRYRGNLAEAYQSVGKHDRALAMHERVLEERKAKLGEDHPDTLESMHNLGIAYRLTGDLDRSLALHEQVVAKAKRKLGPDHPDLVVYVKGQADAYSAKGRQADALPLYKEAVRIGTVHPGRDHPRTLVAVNDLAVAYSAAGQHRDAVPLLDEAFAGYAKKLGRDHPHTVMILGNLARTLLLAKQPERAVPLLEDFLGAMRKALGSDSPRFAGLLAQVSTDLLQFEQPAAAEKHLRECLTIRESKEPTAWTTFNTKSLLGGALLGQKKYDDAERPLLDGYEGLKQRETQIPAPVRQARQLEALDRLVKLYDGWDKPTDAARWRSELEAKKK